MTFRLCQLRSASFSTHVVKLTLDSAFWTSVAGRASWLALRSDRRTTT